MLVQNLTRVQSGQRQGSGLLSRSTKVLLAGGASPGSWGPVTIATITPTLAPPPRRLLHSQKPLWRGGGGASLLTGWFQYFCCLSVTHQPALMLIYVPSCSRSRRRSNKGHQPASIFDFLHPPHSPPSSSCPASVAPPHTPPAPPSVTSVL